MEPIVSHPYVIGRLELAYASAGLYVRLLWWALIGVPIGGIATLVLLHTPIMQYLGAVMVLWPITIPGRALLLTRDQRKMYMQSTVATLREDGFYFDMDGRPATRVLRTWIVRSRIYGDLYCLMGHRGRVVWIKRSAFDDDDKNRIDESLGVTA